MVMTVKREAKIKLKNESGKPFNLNSVSPSTQEHRDFTENVALPWPTITFTPTHSLKHRP